MSRARVNREPTRLIGVRQLEFTSNDQIVINYGYGAAHQSTFRHPSDPKLRPVTSLGCVT